MVGKLALVHRQLRLFDRVEIVRQRRKFDVAGFGRFKQPLQLPLVDAAAVVADAEEEGLMLVAFRDQPVDPVEKLRFLLPARHRAVSLPDAQRDDLAAAVAAPAEQIRHGLLLRHRTHEDVTVEPCCIQDFRQSRILAERIDAVTDPDVAAEFLPEIAPAELGLPEQDLSRRDDRVGLLDPAADRLPAPGSDQQADLLKQRRIARFDPLVAGTR